MSAETPALPHAECDPSELQELSELRHSEARLRLLLEQVPAIVGTVDTDLCVTSLSGRGLAALGMKAGALVGRTLPELAAQYEGLEGMLSAHHRALEGRRAEYEARLDGRALQGTVEPLHDADGQIVGCVGLALDVTHQRRVEDAFDGKLRTVRRRLEDLAGRRDALPPEAQHLVEEVLESSFVAVEELQVTAEELSQQNDELAAAHNELAASRRRYRDLFESAPDGYLVTSPAGVIRQANRAAEELLGVPEVLLREKPLVLYVAEDDRAAFHRHLDRLRAEERAASVEWELRVRRRLPGGEPGPVFPAALTVSPIHDPAGALTGLRWLLRDISPSKRAEERERLLEEARVAAEETQAANDLLHTLLDTMPVGVVVCNAEGELLMTNQPGREILGSSVSGEIEAPERAYTPLYPDGSPFPAESMPLVRAMRDGEAVDGVEILIRRADGSERTLLAGAAPVLDRAGRIVSGVTVFQDISARKATQSALRRYADRLRGLHETDQAILAARSVDEIAEAALARVPRLLDCARASVMLYDREAGDMVLLAVRASEATVLKKGWRGSIETAWAPIVQKLRRGVTVTIEDVQQAPPGSPWHAALQAEQVRALVVMPLRSAGQWIGTLNLGLRRPRPLTPGQLEIAQELSTQLAIGMRQARLHEEVERHAEALEAQVARRTAALRASRAHLQAIIDNSSIGIALVDLDGRVLESNPALVRLLGYSAEELRGMHFKAFTHPQDVEEDLALTAELMAGERQSYVLEKRFVRKDGQVRWVNLYASTIRDVEGRVQYGVGLVDDITERKRAQAALVQSEKLAMIGQLAASLAHEINNPLQSVIGCLGLARETEDAMNAGDDLDELLDIAKDELLRVARIVGRLRDLSRPSDADDRERVGVNDLVDRVLTLSAKQLQNQNIETLQDLAEGLPRPEVVADRIQQVLLNLALNAVDAMPEGGTLRIATRHAAATGEVVITFTDNGAGIPPEVLPRLFTPFFSTKREGIGLGLFVSNNIIQEHGGCIQVESQVGQGTTFVVRLPV